MADGRKATQKMVEWNAAKREEWKIGQTCRRFLSYTISSAFRLEGYVDMGGILHFVPMGPV
jgi:hypothetical protein